MNFVTNNEQKHFFLSVDLKIEQCNLLMIVIGLKEKFNTIRTIWERE